MGCDVATEEARLEPATSDHPILDLQKAAEYLGATLEVACHAASFLVIPKSLSVRLHAVLLLYRYLERTKAALDQFQEDIDAANEHSPDAKSLSDFHEFAVDISDQFKCSVHPITDSSRRCPVLLPICNAATLSVTTFVKEVLRLTRESAEELCKLQLPRFSETPVATQLDELQRLDPETRKSQQSLVRASLDRMQTAAQEADGALARLVDDLRVNAGKLRKLLGAAESICNNHGLQDLANITAGIESLKALC